MEEIWRDVKGYEGLYQVSNLGRVKSLGNSKTRKERILKNAKNTTGYLQVNLCKEAKAKATKIHRLVAQAFIGDIPKGMVINHINGIKTDNRVENLEICTCSHNIKEAFRLGLEKPPFLGKFGEANKTARKITQLDLQGNVINHFYGTLEAERETKVNAIGIWFCLKGKRKTAGGYRWEYF